MPPEQILELLRATPFVGFRIHLTEGRHFDIKHPEMAMLGRQFIILGIPEPTDGNYIGRTKTLSLVHVTSLELLSTANG